MGVALVVPATVAILINWFAGSNPAHLHQYPTRKGADVDRVNHPKIDVMSAD